jgi:hypothetical protein
MPKRKLFYQKSTLAVANTPSDIAKLTNYSANLFELMQTIPVYNTYGRDRVMKEVIRVNRFVKQYNSQC